MTDLSALTYLETNANEILKYIDVWAIKIEDLFIGNTNFLLNL